MTDIVGRVIYCLRTAVDHGPVQNRWAAPQVHFTLPIFFLCIKYPGDRNLCVPQSFQYEKGFTSVRSWTWCWWDGKKSQSLNVPTESTDLVCMYCSFLPISYWITFHPFCLNYKGKIKEGILNVHRIVVYLWLSLTRCANRVIWSFFPTQHMKRPVPNFEFQLYLTLHWNSILVLKSSQKGKKESILLLFWMLYWDTLRLHLVACELAVVKCWKNNIWFRKLFLFFTPPAGHTWACFNMRFLCSKITVILFLRGSVFHFCYCSAIRCNTLVTALMALLVNLFQKML